MSDIYNIARAGFLHRITVGTQVDVQLNWTEDTVIAALMATTYSYSPSHDVEGHTDVSSHIVDKVVLSGKSVDSEGWAVATDATFSAVSGPEVNSVLLFRDGQTNDEDDNILIAHLDTSLSGLPITPNGGDITVLWNAGSAGRIFRL